MSDEAVKKLTVAAAALAYGVPERSLFRAVEKGKLPSSKRDGVTVVDPADVEAWAARRAAPQAASATPAAAAAGQNAPTAAAMPGSLPAAHAPLAVGSGRPPIRPVLDGELTAILITRFKRGETPVDVAEALRLPIPLVLEGHEHYARAKSATAPSQQETRVEQMQAELQTASADIASLMESVGRLGRELAGVSSRVHALIPPPERFGCECGATGFVATQVVCTACGRESAWGIVPRQ